LAALRGGARGSGALRRRLVVHLDAAAAARALGPLPAALRHLALPRRVRARAGRAHRLSGRRLAHGRPAAVDTDDPRRHRPARLGLPRAHTVRQLRARAMKEYLDLLRRIRTEGVRKPDRTGTGTLSLFAQQMRFDLTRGFPLVTTKKVHLRSVVYELLWFLRGETNVAWLKEHGVSIWDEWADAAGELGPVYGRQWRAWASADGRHIDQLAQAVALLKSTPASRRILVSAWNVGELERMHLMPCHAFFQLYVADRRLSLQVYQRSADTFLGVP